MQAVEQFGEAVALLEQLAAIGTASGELDKAFTVGVHAGLTENVAALAGVQLQLLHERQLAVQQLPQARQVALFQRLELVVEQLQQPFGVADIVGEQLEQGNFGHLGLDSGVQGVPALRISAGIRSRAACRRLVHCRSGSCRRRWPA
ncbi:hypothetical protein D3C80_1540660 [compost metagenome]